MKIGIIGGPKSGKSRFAKALGNALEKEDGEDQASVIDGYVDKLAKRTGMVYGLGANYPQNFQIAMHRWTLEQEAANKGFKHIVIAGTIYESILYTGIRLNNDMVLNEDNRDDRTVVRLHGDAAMRAFGMIEAQTADHDLLFFLPFDSKSKLSFGPRSWQALMDTKLPEVVDGYKKLLITLTGTTKEKVSNAIQVTRTLTRIQAEESAVDDASGVQGATSTPQDQGSGSGSVPNVRV